jgi:molybdopterin-guanine dinucleotide biosynthesis protein A
MLLIGAAGRNAGKTELACEVIRRLSPRRAVVGVKVTCVDESLGKCPRGGQGCGVCASLDGPFCIVEERDALGPKDTSRMRRAGAERVLWLRVHKENLQEGVAALIAQIPDDKLIVCESNSARNAIVPGLFFVVRQLGATTVKPSCEAVLPLADEVIDFLGRDRGWSLDPERVMEMSGRFALRPQATAVILAGGKSERMGADKALLDVHGQPMIARIAEQLSFFPELLVSANVPQKFSFLKHRVIPDQWPGKGPLMGIVSCLAQSSHEVCFITGCDTPVIDPLFVLEILAQLGEADVVVPQLPSGRAEPLLAAYKRSIIPTASEMMERGDSCIPRMFDRVRTRYVPFAPPPWYRNLNTPKDYEAFLRGMSERCG